MAYTDLSFQNMATEHNCAGWAVTGCKQQPAFKDLMTIPNPSGTICHSPLLWGYDFKYLALYFHNNYREGIFYAGHPSLYTSRQVVTKEPVVSSSHLS